MKNILTLFFLICIPVSNVMAQEDCEENLKEVKALLNKNSPFINEANILSLLEPCALKGDLIVQNYLGVLYLRGIGVPKKYDKAFHYFSNVATDNNYVEAQYCLGEFYKYGRGCSANYIEAKKWFEKAAENGHQRGMYALGYMYYKGIGVDQDYKQAISWFERSTYPMAKHFLGLCYYYGYGVTSNESKAIEILSDNQFIVNSKTFLTYILAKQKEKQEADIVKELEKREDSTHIAQHIITNNDENIFESSLTQDEIIGDWAGKIIQYDWSGNDIVRIIPIKITINSNDENIVIQSEIKEQKSEVLAQWKDENMYIESGLTVTLDKLYTDNPKEVTLDYKFLSIGLKKKTLSGNTYLTGKIDNFIESWSEYGQPMKIILKPSESKGAINQDLIEALVSQEDQFIKLHPIPFNNNLTIQYELNRSDNVSVELTNINSFNKLVIVPMELQEAGTHTYNVPVSHTLPEGLYVVRVIVGNQTYTKMIVKDNK